MVYDNKTREKIKKIFEDKIINEAEPAPNVVEQEKLQSEKKTLDSIPKLMEQLDTLVKASGVPDLEGTPLTQEELKKYGEEVFKTLNEKNPAIQKVGEVADKVKAGIENIVSSGPLKDATDKVVDKVVPKE